MRKNIFENLLVVVVCYNNELEVEVFAKMLSRQSLAHNLSLLVVVNSHSNDYDNTTFVSLLNDISLNIEVIYPEGNIGYLNGIIYGYNYYINHKKKAEFEWCVMCNTDIIIEDSMFFEKFINNEYGSDVWSVGPSVYSHKKRSYDNPHYIKRCSISDINRVIWVNKHPLFAFAYQRLSAIKSHTLKRKKKDSCNVYSNHGCFIFFRKEFLNHIKDDFYTPLLYSEEAYIAELIQICDKKCYYDSTIEVVHLENSVTGLLSMKKKSRYISDSMKYIRNKFYI